MRGRLGKETRFDFREGSAWRREKVNFWSLGRAGGCEEKPEKQGCTESNLKRPHHLRPLASATFCSLFAEVERRFSGGQAETEKCDTEFFRRSD